MLLSSFTKNDSLHPVREDPSSKSTSQQNYLPGQISTRWTALQSFLTYQSNVWMERLAPVRIVLLHNTLLSSFLLMAIFTFISFLPIIYYTRDYNMNFLDNNPEYDLLYEENYKTWLLISIAVVIPMVIEVILDYSIASTNRIEFNNWISRVTLISALAIPNVVLYFLIVQDSDQINPYLPQVQLSIFFSQQIIIIGSLFCTMFEHRWENVSNPNDRLNISIEERTVYILLTFTIAKLFICFSVLFSNAYVGLYIIASVLAVIGILQIISVLVQSMRFLARQTEGRFQFQSHHHMSDFCHLSAALVFVLTDFALLVSSQRLLDIDPNTPITYSESLYVTEFLYIQVFLTYFLTVIPSRANFLEGEIQKEKLNTRLNLIRYVSHEMRTPLNTAFLGLAMLLTDLKNLTKKYYEKTNALKESARQSDKMARVTEKQKMTARNLTLPSPSSAGRRNLTVPSPSSAAQRNSPPTACTSPDEADQSAQKRNQQTNLAVDTSSSIDEQCSPSIHPFLTAPGSPILGLDEAQVNQLLLPTRESMNTMNANPNNPSNGYHDWFLDKKFVEIFIFGLQSILSAETLEDMIDTVNQIHESCKVALDTLNDLLMFDKIDEQKLVVEVEDIDPWVLLCDTAKPFEINARDANVAFTISCAEADTNWTFATFIKADKFKLSQVIRNLISNALKFTSELGFVKVKLEKIPLRNSTIDDCLDTNIAIRISVEDNGAGISAENQKKLFGQYVQFNAAQLQQGKGSGLGLWISRSIIEMHGGKINAFSAGEGQGSRFYIDLPLYGVDRSKSVDIRGSVDSADSGKSKGISLFRRGLTTISMGALKREPSLFNKPVVLMSNSTRDLELGPGVPVSALARDSSMPDLRRQQTSKLPTDRRGNALLPTNQMPLHVPDVKQTMTNPPPLERADADPAVKEGNETDDMFEELGEFDEEEEDVEAKLGWLDNLKNLFQSPSLSGRVSGRVVRSTRKSAPKKNFIRKRSLVSRILPSASFLSTSSSNYSLPLFVKEREKPFSSPPPPAGTAGEHSFPDSPALQIHLSPEVKRNSIYSTEKGLRGDSEDDLMGEHSSPVHPFGDSMKENEDHRSQYYRLNNVPSTDENELARSQEKSLDGQMIFTPLSLDSLTNAASPGIVPIAAIPPHRNSSNNNLLLPADLTVSAKKKKVRIEIHELGSRSSDVSPTNYQQQLQLQKQLSKLQSTRFHEAEVLPEIIFNRSPTFQSPSLRVVKSWEDGLRILIVDDSAPNRKMLKKLLVSCHHTVYEAKDGIECLELLDYATEEGKGKRTSVGSIDVVLMDDHMPRLSGPETSKLLKRRGFEGAIYAVTGTVEPKEVESFLAAGVEAIFAKPLNVEALKMSINEYYILQAGDSGGGGGRGRDGSNTGEKGEEN